jgi:integrase/recombinase XerD
LTRVLYLETPGFIWQNAKIPQADAIRERPMASVLRLQSSKAVHTISNELEAFLVDAQERRGLSTNTIRSYRCDLRAAAVVLIAPLDDITTADVEAFLVARRELPGTTNRRIASLGQFFVWAMRQGYCTSNPVGLVETKREDEHLPRPIRIKADLKALDTAIAASPQPYRLILTILRETGMRADEVLSLNVGDVTLEAGREGLHVSEAKNGVDRTVVLTPDVMPKSLRGLRAWLRRLGDHPPLSMPLFRSNRSTRVSYDALHYRWIKACKAANLIAVVDGKEQPFYTIHQLRHTVGSTLIAQYPEHIVSRMLGHRDPRSTRRYAEVNEDKVRAALTSKHR